MANASSLMMASLDDVYGKPSAPQQRPVENAMRLHNSNTPHMPHTLIQGQNTSREMETEQMGSHEQVQQAIAREKEMSNMQQMQQMGVPHGAAQNGQPLNFPFQPHGPPRRPPHVSPHGSQHGPLGGPQPGTSHGPPHNSILKTAGETRLPPYPNRVHFSDEMPKYTYNDNDDTGTAKGREKNKAMSRLAQKTGPKVLMKGDSKSKNIIIFAVVIFFCLILGVAIALFFRRKNGGMVGGSLSIPQLQSAGLPSMRGGGGFEGGHGAPKMSMSNFFAPSTF